LLLTNLWLPGRNEEEILFFAFTILDLPCIRAETENGSVVRKTR
jgi:hypothetical protein